MSIPSEVIRQLSEFDAATLYEAAGRRGMVDPEIRPMWQGARLCGPAMTVRCPPRDNLMLHHAVVLAEPGAVLVANCEGYRLAGAWGEVLTAAAQARGIAGLAIDGAVRDIEAVAERRFPVFSRGLAIGACKKEGLGALNEPVDLGGVAVRPGDLIVGTGDGLVVLMRESVWEVLSSAAARREREREMFRGLTEGKTTIELLDLPRPGEKRESAGE
jgi:4-hydroxy-4-methyl-2-oxoglutarate aldolase